MTFYTLQLGEEAVAYSLARGKAAAVTLESREVGSGVLSGAREKATAVSCTWAAPGHKFLKSSVSKTNSAPACLPELT